MDTYSADMQAATIDDAFGLATWNRPRTTEELQAFIKDHHDRLPDDVTVE